MLSKKLPKTDTVASRVLSHVRDYGAANEKGQLFDRIFNRGDVVRQIRASRNVVGQGVNQMLSPDGSAVDGFSMYMPALGISGSTKIDPDKIQNAIAENQARLARILETMRQDPVKGAAMLRNRVTCVQHSTQWIDGMSRIMAGSIGDAPAEMVATVREFLTREIGR